MPVWVNGWVRSQVVVQSSIAADCTHASTTPHGVLRSGPLAAVVVVDDKEVVAVVLVETGTIDVDGGTAVVAVDVVAVGVVVEEWVGTDGPWVVVDRTSTSELEEHETTVTAITAMNATLMISDPSEPVVAKGGPSQELVIVGRSMRL